MRAPIILLNGTSSSGKTTLARAFQRTMAEPVLYVSNDHFIFMTPDPVLKDDARRPRVLLPLLSAFHRSLPLIASCGLPMIIDHVIERRDWMDEIAEQLEGLNVYFVRVECPLEELERREHERGGRQIGLARMQLDWVHRHGGYDAVLDTFHHTLDENVAKLKELIRSEQKPIALDHYRQQKQA
ncbi:chloramphenicol 3-O phosphotransferase [Prosthecobacter debontii]|uniref:Chloramphenicol 3-O phosphotransferase n=1 Tax=Prosthecobacter debontii TaxID=48467 RepID=A0A1T4XS34_9BACT|nr:AAA family ATPase [Prosthecobacter debontii]SKA91861.1 chloramphenicol 3-O phosphotransferase [Prosthecobacter debontii]